MSKQKTITTGLAVALSVFSLHCFGGSLASNALPTGGQVLAGNASIVPQAGGSVLNVNQTSQRAVVQWSTFNVGSQATVNFNQPNAQAATLNYINGVTKSVINGSVNANGQVIFVNNNGVIFGKGAQVNVGGMVASTLNPNADEFMSGASTQHYAGGASGKIVNHGHLNATDLNGYIALMAPSVVNTGVVTATMSGGNAVALVAGQKVSLNFQGNQLLSVSVDASVINALVANRLLIQTNGGSVIIAANAAQDLMNSVVNVSGEVLATGISRAGGKVFLSADTVLHSGTVATNSDVAAGGQVQITGNTIILAGGSRTLATGATKGGQIDIGLSHGLKPSANNIGLSKVVQVNAGALVDASANTNGSGGNIRIWSSNQTLVAGSLYAKGGALGGDGGFIETSSLGKVTYGASLKLDTSAPFGKTGTWLTDPLAIVIDGLGAKIIESALASTNVILDANADFSGFGATAANLVPSIAFLSGADINSTNPNTSLTLLANGGSIDVQSHIYAGAISALANIINLNQGGSLGTLGGPGGNIYLAGAILNILGSINASGSTSNNLNSASGLQMPNISIASSGNMLQLDKNAYTGNGNNITLIAKVDVNIGSNSLISANGLLGGNITIVAANGNANNSGAVFALGKGGRGGTIAIAGAGQTNLAGSLMSVDGVLSGGLIQVGVIRNIGGSAWTLAPPAIGSPMINSFLGLSAASGFDIISQVVFLDSVSLLSASALPAGFINVGQPTVAGQIALIGDQSLINNANLFANADIGGVISLSSSAGKLQNTGYIQTNGGAGLGGTIALNAASDINLSHTIFKANGTLGGGKIYIQSIGGGFKIDHSALLAQGVDSATTGGTLTLSSALDSVISSSNLNVGVDLWQSSSEGGSIAVKGRADLLSDVSTSYRAGSVAINAYSLSQYSTLLAQSNGSSVVSITAETLLQIAGSITAQNANSGGKVALNAKGILMPSDALIVANGLTGGAITIMASDSALLSGTLQAKGDYGLGGIVTLNATEGLSLFGAHLDVSGALGGGHINIGVNAYLGSVISKQITVDVYSSLIADALDRGNGGFVQFHAANQGKFGATISAQGGIGGGNGGWAEISAGKLTLTQASNATKLNARSGGYQAGVLLLDPATVTIVDGSLGAALWSDFSNAMSAVIAQAGSNSKIGAAVALNDNNVALIGASGVSSGRGNAYLYNFDTTSKGYLAAGAWRDLATTSAQPITALAANSGFGYAVALNNNNIALIGAWGVSSNRGNAYLYNLSTTAQGSLAAGSWRDLATTSAQPITALAANSGFGYAVALNNNNIALIGAYGVSSRGNAYLYNLSTSAQGSLAAGAWSDLATTSAQPITALAAPSYFGYAVALNNNNVALIGAYGVSSTRGNAYLYNFNTSAQGSLAAGAWSDLATTSAQPISALAANSYFGGAVALNNNNVALIGAYGVSSQGNAYLYNFNTSAQGSLAAGSWLDLATTSAQPISALAANSYFGGAVALNNNNVALIGAYGVSSNRGNAYLYNFNTSAQGSLAAGAWSDLATTSAQPISALAASSNFGYAVALNNNNVALIGAYGVSSNRGNAYLYNFNTSVQGSLAAGAWRDLATTSAQPISALAANSYFGGAVALNDNNVALIGAYGVSSTRGNAYLYNFNTSAQGSLAAGAWLDLATTSAQPITALAANSFFGVAVALNNNNVALIGARGVSSDRGNAYLYNFNTSAQGSLAAGAWLDLATTSAQPITALAAPSYFGYAVALNNNNVALIGAFTTNFHRGNAYLYNLSTSAQGSLAAGAWRDLATTSAQPITALASGSLFGIAVALNDNNVALIGANGMNSYRGNAYLYNFDTSAQGSLAAGAWRDLATTSGQPITALAANSYFGVTAALNNNNVALIGAYGVSSQGNAYLYNLSTSAQGSLAAGAWRDLATTSAQPISTLAANSYFGFAVALNNNNVALIGAFGANSERGNAYLYNFNTSAQGSLAAGAWLDLATTGAEPITLLASGSYFGFAVALNNNNVALIGARSASGGRGNAYSYNFGNYNAYYDSAVTYISPSQISTYLASANVVILADNVINLNQYLNLSEVAGTNKISFISGGSINFNYGLNLGNHALVLVANAANSTPDSTNPAASFNSANRLAGAANITISAEIFGLSTINASITNAAATGRTDSFAQVGSITVGAGAPLYGSRITLDADVGSISAAGDLHATSATAGAITLSALTTDLTNSALVVPTAGSWYIYTTDITSAAQSDIILGQNTSTFARFSCTLASGCTNGAVIPASGSGVLAAWAPVLSLTASPTSRIYDGTTTGSLTSPVISSGLISTGIFSNPVTVSSASYTLASANVGSSTPISSVFTLSNANLGYLSSASLPTVTITPKSLTVTGTVVASKTYDGTTSASFTNGGTLVGVIAGDAANVSLNTAGSYSAANVGAAIPMNMADTLGGSAAGNYTLTQPTVTGAITARPLGLSNTTATYVGSTTIAAGNGSFTLTNLAPVDSAATVTSATVNNANATTNAGATYFTTVSLNGASASNYSLNGSANPTAGTNTTNTVNLAQAGLTVTGTVVASKTYDGTTSASFTNGGTLVGVIAGDAANVSLNTAGSYSAANVGAAIPMNMADTLGGSAAGNYTLTQPTVTGAITARPLGLSNTTATYVGSTTIAAGNGSFTLTNLAPVDSAATVTSATVNNANATTNAGATYFTTVSLNGASASNYSLNGSANPTAGTNTTNTVNLAQAGLTVTGTVVASKTYDGTTSASFTNGGTLVGVIAGDAANVSLNTAGSYSAANVGAAIPMNMADTLGGSAAGNYTLTQPTVTGAITARPLGLSNTTATYVGSTTIAAGNGSFTLTNLAPVDSAATVTSATVNNANATTNAGATYFTTVSLNGASASNYSLNGSANPTAGTNTTNTVNLAQAGLTVTGTVVASKTYDGTTSASFTNGGTLVGVIAGDAANVSLNTAGSYSAANVGAAIPMNMADTLGGSAAGNYTLTQPTVTGAITARPLGLSNTTATYVGSTTIAAGNGSFTLTNLAPVDSAATVTSATVNNANATTNAGATYFTTVSLNGASASNYSLNGSANPTAGTNTTNTVNLAQAGLTVTGTVVASKTYDGTTSASFTNGGTLVGVIAGDAANVSLNTAGSYSAANVGAAIPMNMADTLGGSAAGNYTLTQPTVTGAITARPLGLSNTTATYVGSTTIAAGNGSFTLTNLAPVDSAATVTSATVNNANATTNAGATYFTTVSLNGASASNYSLNGSANPTAGTNTTNTVNLAQAGLTVTGTVVASKTYDGTTSASFTNGGTLVGVIAGDAANVSLNTAGSYSAANVGAAIPMNMADTLGGSAAGNYTLTQPTVTGAITAPNIGDNATQDHIVLLPPVSMVPVVGGLFVSPRMPLPPPTEALLPISVSALSPLIESISERVIAP